MDRITVLNVRKKEKKKKHTRTTGNFVVCETLNSQVLRKEYEQDNNTTPKYSFIIQILKYHPNSSRHFLSQNLIPVCV